MLCNNYQQIQTRYSFIENQLLIIAAMDCNYIWRLRTEDSSFFFFFFFPLLLFCLLKKQREELMVEITHLNFVVPDAGTRGHCTTNRRRRGHVLGAAHKSPPQESTPTNSRTSNDPQGTSSNTKWMTSYRGSCPRRNRTAALLAGWLSGSSRR